LPGSAYIAVNVSGVPLINFRYTHRVADLLVVFDVDHSRMHLEAIETALLNTTELVGHQMRRLASQGVLLTRARFDRRRGLLNRAVRVPESARWGG
jgi:EAL domain-containing protein (putative c-di-GMP-specific phosphodiesterase class I)